MVLVRRVLQVCGLAVLGTVLSLPARPLELWALRGLYQFGEWIGITQTPPAVGAAWGGQVAGFTYARPPHWWGFTVGILGFGVPLVLVFAAMLWCSARRWERPRRPTVASLLLASALGALCSGLVSRFAGAWLMFRGVDLFEWMGGTVTRLGGPMMTGPQGPFHGTSWADAAGNWCVGWGPWIIPVLAGAGVSLLVFSRLRRTPLALQCQRCGYDRRGIGRGSPCPECGAAATGEARPAA